MNALLQLPKPGVSATYRLIWAPYIPAFAVVESEEQLECAEWWLPVPSLAEFTIRDYGPLQARMNRALNQSWQPTPVVRRFALLTRLAQHGYTLGSA